MPAKSTKSGSKAATAGSGTAARTGAPARATSSRSTGAAKKATTSRSTTARGRSNGAARSNGTRGTDAFKLLKTDHQNVKKLFRQYEKAEDDTRTKQQVAQQVFEELRVHTQVEEEIFYPAGEQAGGELAEEMIPEAYEEHNVVKKLIEEMKSLAPEADEYDAKFKVMMENVEHHIEEEEGELFPKMDKELGTAAAREIGRRMEEHKQSLMATKGAR